jgi:hypothetical protein
MRQQVLLPRLERLKLGCLNAGKRSLEHLRQALYAAKVRLHADAILR